MKFQTEVEYDTIVFPEGRLLADLFDHPEEGVEIITTNLGRSSQIPVGPCADFPRLSHRCTLFDDSLNRFRRSLPACKDHMSVRKIAGDLYETANRNSSEGLAPSAISSLPSDLIS